MKTVWDNKTKLVGVHSKKEEENKLIIVNTDLKDVEICWLSHITFTTTDWRLLSSIFHYSENETNDLVNVNSQGSTLHPLDWWHSRAQYIGFGVRLQYTSVNPTFTDNSKRNIDKDGSMVRTLTTVEPRKSGQKDGRLMYLLKLTPVIFCLLNRLTRNGLKDWMS